MIQTCALCDCINKNSICDACYSELPWNHLACLRCALPLVTDQGAYCGQCQQHATAYERTISLFHYQSPIDYLIGRFKFQQNLALGKILSRLLSNKLQNFYAHNSKPTLIIPVPLHRKRLIERGFNQSLELAKPIAKKLNIPLNYSVTQRTRNTLKQSELAVKERAKNVRGAFSSQFSAPAHIAVVDDVITTGHTIQEFCHCLKQAGAKKIDVWCIARTNIK